MPSFSGNSGLLRRFIDPRPAHEIEDDIRDELRFHVEEATDALVASGLALDLARERAMKNFGDIERVRGACRRVQLGDRIMLQRIQWVVIAVLVLALVTLGFRSVSMQRQEMAARQMAEARMHEAEAMRAFLNASLLEAQTGRATAEELVKAAGEAADKDARVAVPPWVQVELDGQATIDAWLNSLKADLSTWRVAITIGEEIASTLAPTSALQAMQTIYPQLSLEQRQQIFKPFISDGGHPMAVQILKLGVSDAEPKMRGRAYYYLSEYAFQDLSEWKSDDIAAWYERVGEMPLDRLFEDSARGLVSRLASTNTDSDEFAKQVRFLMTLNFEAARKYDPAFSEQLERAGLLALIRDWSASGRELTRVFALRAAGWLSLDSDRLRSEVLSAMERNPNPPTDAVWAEYCNLVGRRGNTWATTPLLERYRSVLASSAHNGDLFAPAMALAKIADSNAIPQLIGLLTASDTQDNRYAIGYFGLRDLTGVAWDESHDAQWWSTWWQQNQGNFAGVTNPTIPTFSLNK